MFFLWKEPQISVVFAQVNTNPMGKKNYHVTCHSNKVPTSVIKWLKYVLKVMIRKIPVKISKSGNQLIY